MITIDLLNQRLGLLTNERIQAVDAVSRYDGAIAQLKWEIAQVTAVEALAVTEVKAKRQAPKCKGRGCNKKAQVEPEVASEPQPEAQEAEEQQRIDAALEVA